MKKATGKPQKFCPVQSHKHYLQNVITSTIQNRILLLKTDPVLDYWVFVWTFLFPNQTNLIRLFFQESWDRSVSHSRLNKELKPILSPFGKCSSYLTKWWPLPLPSSCSLSKSTSDAQVLTTAAMGSTLWNPHRQMQKWDSSELPFHCRCPRACCMLLFYTRKTWILKASTVNGVRHRYTHLVRWKTH